MTQRAGVVFTLWFFCALASLQGQSRSALRSVRVEWRIAGEGQDYQLTLVGAIQVLPMGDLVVLDVARRQLLAFGERGQFRRAIGRSGQGPGEFANPAALGIRGDSVWVGDPALRRITIFGVDGTVVRTIPVTGGGVPLLLADDDLLMVPQVQLGVVRSESRLIVERVRSNTGAKTTILDAPTATIPLNLNFGTARRVARQPFEDTPIVRWSQDSASIVYVDRRASAGSAPAVRVWKVNSSGVTIFDRITRLPVQALDPELVDAEVERIAESVGRRVSEMPPSLLRARIRQALYIPREAPLVTQVLGAQDGMTWLRQSAAVSGVARWTVLSRDGLPAFELELPANVDVLWANGEVVYATLTNSEGVPSIVRYRFE
jgi:hypothetical protein